MCFYHPQVLLIWNLFQCIWEFRIAVHVHYNLLQKQERRLLFLPFPLSLLSLFHPLWLRYHFFFSHLEHCLALYLIFVDKAQGIGLHFELLSQSNSLCVTKRTPGRDFIFFNFLCIFTNKLTCIFFK